MLEYGCVEENAKDFGVKWRGTWILALPPASYITLCHLTFFICKMENKKPISHVYWKIFLRFSETCSKYNISLKW